MCGQSEGKMQKVEQVIEVEGYKLDVKEFQYPKIKLGNSEYFLLRVFAFSSGKVNALVFREEDQKIFTHEILNMSDR